MPVQIVINKCGECPYVDHSGAFTPGGPKDICQHRQAIEAFTTEETEERNHWRYRVIDREAEPPPQCPLRQE